jgi:citrate synthase
MENFFPGLENVIAGKTRICYLDPNKGLYYRGYSIEDLFLNSKFEEVAYLLLYGKLPNEGELKNFLNKIKENLKVPKEVFKQIKFFPKNSNLMNVLASSVSLLSQFDKNENDYERAVSLISKFPVILANSYRILNGKKVINPKKNFNIAKNFFYILNDKNIDEKICEIFDKTLILYAEHEFNSSTFACRVTSSTLSDYYSSIVSGIVTLKGKLHGGANEEAMKMILEIGEESNVENYLREHLKIKGWRMMGFGHRVYKGVEDPRAKAMKNLLKELSEYKNNFKYYNIATKIEELVLNENFMREFIPDYGITKPKFYPNVDFYCGPLYYLMNIPLELYTPIFAMARIVGWSAHIIEQYEDMKRGEARLFRPRSIYIGEKDLKYIPIKERR